jgi:hypothetical protein
MHQQQRVFDLPGIATSEKTNAEELSQAWLCW